MIADKLMGSAIDHLMRLKDVADGKPPEGWNVSPLSDFLDSRQKINVPDDAEVPFLPMASISDGYSGENIPEVRIWHEVRKGYTVFRPNDVLVAKITPCFQNRKSTIAPRSDWSAGAGTTELHVLRPGNLVFPRYLLWLTKSNYFIDSLVPKMTGTAGQKRVPRSALEGLTIAVPTLAEQERIVRLLDALKPEIELLAVLEREREYLDDRFVRLLRNSWLQAGISGHLTLQVPEDVDGLLRQVQSEKTEYDADSSSRTILPKEEDFNPPFEIPNSWRWCKLGEVLTLVNGRAYKRHEMLEVGKWPLLRVGNLFTSDRWYYSDLELPPEKYCEQGDLLYAWSASFGPFIWEGGRSIFHYHIWNVRYFSLNRDFIYFALMEDALRLGRSKTGATMAHVSMKNMVDRPLPIPGLIEQAAIVQVLETGLSAINDINDVLGGMR